MVALVAARRVFHIAQQGVHFGQGELPPRTHRTVARHGGEYPVFHRFHGLRAAHAAQFAQHVLRQCHGIGLAQHSRHGTHGNLPVAFVRKQQAVFAQCFPVFGQHGAFGMAGGKHGRNQQHLRLQAALLPLRFHFFVIHAFGGGVHIDQNQAFRRLRQNINAQELRQREAQRIFGRFGRFGFGCRLLRGAGCFFDGEIIVAAIKFGIGLQGGAVFFQRQTALLRRAVGGIGRGSGRGFAGSGHGCRFGVQAALGVRKTLLQNIARIAHAARYVRARAFQRFVQGVKHQPVHGLAVAEADFGFGWMHVHVHHFRRHFQK